MHKQSIEKSSEWEKRSTEEMQHKKVHSASNSFNETMGRAFRPCFSWDRSSWETALHGSNCCDGNKDEDGNACCDSNCFGSADTIVFACRN